MEGEWQTLTVDQIKAQDDRAIAIGPFGSRLKADTYVASGVPVIRGNNISDTRVFVDEFVYVSEQTADELKACNVFAGDLVFPHRGAIGQVGIVPATETPRFMLSTSLMKLTCNKEIVDPLFVFYFFRSTLGRHALLQHASTVGTPGIGQPLTSLRSIRLPIPPIPEQCAIAHILGTLDDKIELNRCRNRTLEAMARALFKDWFVDFRPVRSKMEGREPYLPADLWQLFPDRLDDEGKPEGWEMVPLDNIANLVTTSISPGKTPDIIFEHYSIPAFDAGQMPAMELGETIKSNKYIVDRAAVLVSKLNPLTPRVWLPMVSTHHAVCSTEFMQFVPRELNNRAFIYSLMTSQAMKEQILSHVTGSTGSRQRAQPSQIAKLEILCPASDILRAFSHKAEPLLNVAKTNQVESQYLAQLRDTLLPKLISGELRIGGAEKFFEAAQ